MSGNVLSKCQEGRSPSPVLEPLGTPLLPMNGPLVSQGLKGDAIDGGGGGATGHAGGGGGGGAGAGGSDDSVPDTAGAHGEISDSQLFDLVADA